MTKEATNVSGEQIKDITKPELTVKEREAVIERIKAFQATKGTRAHGGRGLIMYNYLKDPKTGKATWNQIFTHMILEHFPQADEAEMKKIDKDIRGKLGNGADIIAGSKKTKLAETFNCEISFDGEYYKYEGEKPADK